jgi:hypothetical protein
MTSAPFQTQRVPLSQYYYGASLLSSFNSYDSLLEIRGWKFTSIKDGGQDAVPTDL